MMDNTYTIFSCGGKEYVVDENTTNMDTSLSLIGHGLPDYGEEQNTNFLHLLENFASKEEPRNPIVGQLWYMLSDTGNELRICVNADTNDSRWIKISTLFNDESNNHKTGDMKYDTTTHSLYVFDENLNNGLGGWNNIGPDNSKNKMKMSSNFIIDGEKIYTQLSKDIFKDDIDLNDNGSVGNLNMIKMTIMVKECSKVIPLQSRSCGWIYTFLLRSIKNTSGTYTVNIVGTPSYELIGRSNNTDGWKITIDDSDKNYININFVDEYNTNASSIIDASCYYDIIRM